MKNRWMSLAAMAVASLTLLGGCETMEHVETWEDINEAVAVMHGTEGHEDVTGAVRLVRQEDESVLVIAEFNGLEPNSVHGFHIHQYGDCTAPDATSAGGHYAPEGHKHALPGEKDERHAGDLGNLRADANGYAYYKITVDNISIADLKNPVIGRGVILHAEADKGYAEQPSGAAGARIACGVIGVANPGPMQR